MELTREELNKLIKIHNRIKNPSMTEIAILQFSNWIIKAKIDFISETMTDVVDEIEGEK